MFSDIKAKVKVLCCEMAIRGKTRLEVFMIYNIKVNMYSGSSWHEEGVLNWSWPLMKMVLVRGHYKGT